MTQKEFELAHKEFAKLLLKIRLRNAKKEVSTMRNISHSTVRRPTHVKESIWSKKWANEQKISSYQLVQLPASS